MVQLKKETKKSFREYIKLQLYRHAQWLKWPATPGASADLQRWTVTEPYLDIRGGLLEGPFYTAERNELRFVDLDYEKVYFLDLAKGPSSMRVLHTESPIGYVSPLSSLSGPNDGKILHTDTHGLVDL